MRDLRRRLEKLEAKRKPKRWPVVWYDFTPGTMENGHPLGMTINLGTGPEDPIPQECEWVGGLGWCLLDDEHRREFQEDGRWDPAIGVPRMMRPRGGA